MTHFNFASALFVATIALCVCNPKTDAAILLPNPEITASQTPHSLDYVADNVFNQDHTQISLPGGAGNDYSSSGSAGLVAFLDFDFGSPTYITEFHYWERPQNADSVFGFNLILDDNADFSSPIRVFTFAEPIGSADFALLPDDGNGVSTREEFRFSDAATGGVPGITARYVRWEVTSSQNGFDGATEMRFFTAPEPASLGLGMFGALAVGILLWRRRSSKS